MGWIHALLSRDMRWVGSGPTFQQTKGSTESRLFTLSANKLQVSFKKKKGVNIKTLPQLLTAAAGSAHVTISSTILYLER